MLISADATGGTNPALRTFYYRLLRLISHSINPIFVFDGPNKPPFKRNKHTGHNVASVPEFLAKQLLKQFGFPIHLAPGEAEAECALLQREGIVDAVLSEDVDTLMFGSGLTLRNWSPEAKSSKVPTHVNIYDAEKTKSGQSGLDREGMILVALMSGGDYIPEGIPNCGPKTACEAARAGFGKDLCSIRKGDAKGFQEWRDRLSDELKTNKSKLFKRKHTALVIPEDFPRTDILKYYTHPAISTQTGLDKLRRNLKWDQDLDFAGLREFAGDAFDWAKLGGAKKFIRNLAPALLVRNLRMRGEGSESRPDDLDTIQEEEAKLVKSIHGKRNHPTTDYCTELRIAFIPIELVDIDLEKEEPDDELPEDDSEDEVILTTDAGDGEETNAAKKRGPSLYDPTKLDKIWLLETYVRVGVPLKVQDWEEGSRKPKKAATPKAPQKPKASGGTTRKTNDIGMVKGALDRFAKVTKPGVTASQNRSKSRDSQPPPSSFRMPPTLHESPPRSQRTVVDLLSSPAPQVPATSPQTTIASSLRDIQEELPSTVTKRRRRDPLTRSQTMPTYSSSSPCRPPTPGLRHATLDVDILGSPVLPSPSDLGQKKARTRKTTPAPPGPATPTRAPRQISMPPPSSAGRRSRQITLEESFFQASQSVTPTAARFINSPTNPPPILQATAEDVEHVDLCASSPAPAPMAQQPAAKPAPKASRRTKPKASTTARPALRSISSNASKTSTTSTVSKQTPHPPTRRSPRRLRSTPNLPIEEINLAGSPPPQRADSTPNPAVASTPNPAVASEVEIESVDLTSSLAKPPTAPQPTQRSSTSPIPRRSLRHHAISNSPLKQKGFRNRAIRIRESFGGGWDYVDARQVGLASSPATSSADAAGKVSEGYDAGRKKDARLPKVWRESLIESVDLTGM
jgi:Holliday junction resolvase YEN1